MGPKLIQLLLLAAALALCGCHTVTSMTPVGDKVPALDPNVWNGKWRCADGTVATTKIKDSKLGIVEVKTFQPWTKPKPGEIETIDVLVRTLDTEVIVNETVAREYQFERVSISGDYIATFEADNDVFEKLIKRHKIAGTLDRDQNGKLTGSCTIEGLNGRDYVRLKKEGVDVRSLFKEDPSDVFIRGHGWW